MTSVLEGKSFTPTFTGLQLRQVGGSVAAEVELTHDPRVREVLRGDPRPGPLLTMGPSLGAHER